MPLCACPSSLDRLLKRAAVVDLDVVLLLVGLQHSAESRQTQRAPDPSLAHYSIARTTQSGNSLSKPQQEPCLRSVWVLREELALRYSSSDSETEYPLFPEMHLSPFQKPLAARRLVVATPSKTLLVPLWKRGHCCVMSVSKRRRRSVKVVLTFHTSATPFTGGDFACVCVTLSLGGGKINPRDPRLLPQNPPS